MSTPTPLTLILTSENICLDRADMKVRVKYRLNPLFSNLKA